MLKTIIIILVVAVIVAVGGGILLWKKKIVDRKKIKDRISEGLEKIQKEIEK